MAALRGAILNEMVAFGPKEVEKKWSSEVDCGLRLIK